MRRLQTPQNSGPAGRVQRDGSGIRAAARDGSALVRIDARGSGAAAADPLLKVGPTGAPVTTSATTATTRQVRRLSRTSAKIRRTPAACSASSAA
jgi:hypothetical protein